MTSVEKALRTLRSFPRVSAINIKELARIGYPVGHALFGLCATDIALVLL